MNFPADLKYTKSDEWVRVDANAGTATLGISDYAQNALSDIVYVELPAVGDAFQKGDPFGSVESVKAASDVYLPAGGTITAINEALSSTPEVVNSDPYGQGWMVKWTLSSPSDLEGLMDAAAYQKYCDERKQ
jgi:glycine cleavage system H protein